LKITADTNILIRIIIQDVETQAGPAEAALAAADLVALPLTALCEMVWVLSQGYKIPAATIAVAIRRLTDASNVVFNEDAVAAGLQILEAGGGFADGVIAFEGRQLGAETFLSFDKKAVRLLQRQGYAAQLLA